jgi:Aspartyl/Asparaginyl beta-hydroxylase
MRLKRPLYQLPVLFDIARLQEEVAALPAEAWAPHPDQVEGNSAARLITVGGQDVEGFHGQMAPTRWLEAMPFARQILAGFGVVWSRSRLMRLAPGVGVPEHADINYHWHARTRLHIPIFTSPEVRFHCDGASVDMAAGEAWVLDNWRRHHVENAAPRERIHLVADTSGTAAFWQFVQAKPPPRPQWRTVKFDPSHNRPLLTEADQRTPVMPAAEVQLLVEDLRAELTAAVDNDEARLRIGRLSQLLEDFVFDWRQLCALHGVSGRGRDDFLQLANVLQATAPQLAQGLIMRTNSADAMLVLQKRVIQYLVQDCGRA